MDKDTEYSSGNCLAKVIVSCHIVTVLREHPRFRQIPTVLMDINYSNNYRFDRPHPLNSHRLAIHELNSNNVRLLINCQQGHALSHLFTLGVRNIHSLRYYLWPGVLPYSGDRGWRHAVIHAAGGDEEERAGQSVC